jgi:hypothetical protein
LLTVTVTEHEGKTKLGEREGSRQGWTGMLHRLAEGRAKA